MTIERAAQPAGDAILDTPDTIPAIWGHEDDVLWAEGEGLMICGPQGTGKTTLMQQLALSSTGIGPSGLLGYPVRRITTGVVVYLAMDRPAQALRSMRRMVSETDRPALNQRMIIWSGPLPFKILEDPSRLAAWLTDLNARAVFIDSMKDLAVGLASDDVGAAVNQAMQHTISAGIDTVAGHHQRKQPQGERKPRGLDDVYGSTWLTSGQGSVLMLWGEPGDSYVELAHLKQPDGVIGPLKVLHDHHAGRSTVAETVDALAMARNGGVTAAEYAIALNDVDRPDRNQAERARRKLDKLVRDGLLRTEQRTNGGPKPTTMYLPNRLASVPDIA